MSVPEVEVRSFKQQGGETLKDAWYGISNAHLRCTKKYSTLILLRNFYVGISTWNRHVLDTLTGGNFLGTPALEAYNLLESLVGTSPIEIDKTGDNLENVIKRLDTLEKNLPNFLDNTSQVNESVEGIIKRIKTLEASSVIDNRNHRIGKLEQAMEALGSTFSSFKFKKEKTFVGKEQSLCMFPECLYRNLTIIHLLLQI